MTLIHQFLEQRNYRRIVKLRLLICQNLWSRWLIYISFAQSLLYLCIPIYYILEYISSMGAIKTILENHLPGVHVHSLMIGKSPNEDTLNGFFMNVNHQMEIACDLIKNDPLLQDG